MKSRTYFTLYSMSEFGLATFQKLNSHMYQAPLYWTVEPEGTSCICALGHVYKNVHSDDAQASKTMEKPKCLLTGNE